MSSATGFSGLPESFFEYLRGSSCTLDTLSSVSFALNETGTFPWKFDVVCSNMIDNAELLSLIERVGIQVYARGDAESHIQVL